MDRRMDEWMDLEEWMDGLGVDGWMDSDEWMDGWMGEWMS